jgi:hypothetical protein
MEKPYVSPQIEEFLLNQLDSALKNLKELLQRKWMTIGDMFIALCHCRTIESALFRIDHESGEEYLQTAKEILKKKFQETPGGSREWLFVFAVSREAYNNYKEEVKRNPAKKDVLSWWREIKNISKVKQRPSA